MNLALELRSVVKRYGRQPALNGLDLEVRQGAVFGLVGSNGAGKTTALAVSAGLLRIQGGTVNVLGTGPFDPQQHSGRVTLLPQDSRLPPHATPAELLAYYARLQGLAPGEAAASIAEVLAWTHLEARRAAPVRTLSHGMVRRVIIAQAFLGQPELVLLDEPLSGLDPREAARIRELIRQRRDSRATVVISSHNLHEIEALCDEVAFIEAGRRLRQSPVAAITERCSRITYHLETQSVPLAELQALDPAWSWAWDPNTCELSVSFAGPAGVGTVNARVLEVLLRHRVTILEIRRGARLERAYLALTQANQPAPGGPAGPEAPAWLSAEGPCPP